MIPPAIGPYATIRLKADRIAAIFAIVQWLNRVGGKCPHPKKLQMLTCCGKLCTQCDEMTTSNGYAH